MNGELRVKHILLCLTLPYANDLEPIICGQ